MGKRGPTAKVSFDDLYFRAQDLYLDFRSLANGRPRIRIDEDKYHQALVSELKNAGINLDDKPEDMDDDNSGITEYVYIAIEKSIVSTAVKGDRSVLDELFDASDEEQIRAISEDAFVCRDDLQRHVLNWPIREGSMLPQCLSRFPGVFLEATQNDRFPNADKTNELKKFWFISRVLAGASYGLRARTAINLVGSIRPDQMLKRSRDAKPVRQRKVKAVVDGN